MNQDYKKTMEIELKILLDELCLNQGFCLKDNDFENIISKKHLYADEFSKLVLIGEGLNPDTEVKHFRNIKKIFSDLFGNELQESDYS